MSVEEKVQLSAGSAALTIAPNAGGRAASLVVDAMELLAGMDDSPVGWGCFPMVPWQGRLAGNAVSWGGRSYAMPLTYEKWALHGLSFTRPWHVVEATGDVAVLGVELGAGPDDPWPWPCDVVATWRLRPESLETTLEVSSRGTEFPVELGWHPWFRRVLDHGDPVQFDLGSGRMFRRGSDDLLTGELVEPSGGPYDDAFEVVGGRVALRWPGALDLSCQTDCGYAVVFDHLSDVVCLEPETAPPDWINRAPGIARPGKPRAARATWTWSASRPGASADAAPTG